ncbi:MAG TPA: phosphoribosyltransferase [Blastocatellia bacterium]|nr:phosphoribosyltransferase [Blastocatellia bacterium]HMY72599.1 phosphoribosyltransferase [Blastocatellia bacterium]
MVDDFIGQGGTLANLKGFLESHGASVIGATVLTGKAYSAKLALTNETLQRLREKYGDELETWWVAAFGYGFECLTESEARYLTRADDADAIRTRIVAASRKRS